MPTATQTGPVVAIIPARGGSKGVPRKNLMKIGGQSLVERAVTACTAAASIDLVTVTTDDDEIADAARSAGALVIDRPADLAGDEASSESALLHALETLDSDPGIDAPSIVVFVQCTSPFIDPQDLDAAVQQIRADEADSVFAAVESFHFLWEIDGTGHASGVNHDESVRLRRQDREPQWLETGAFYAFTADGFRAAGHRFFGRIGVQPVPALDATEIDTPEDVSIVRSIADRRGGPALDLSGVRALVMDFDGVHTDDRATVGQDGAETVTVSRSDGHGVKLLRHAGIKMLILSTERNPVVARRAEKLGVECLQGIEEKSPALRSWLHDHGLDAADVAYVGNDVNDRDCLEAVGYPMSVADAHPEIRALARYVTAVQGGHGAVREIAEAILVDRAYPREGHS